MKTVTVRVSSEIRRTLQQLAIESQQSMQSVLARAVEEYKRHWILERTNEAYAALRGQPDFWKEEQEERHAWEATLADDLKDEVYRHLKEWHEGAGMLTIAGEFHYREEIALSKRQWQHLCSEFKELLSPLVALRQWLKRRQGSPQVTGDIAAR